MCRMAPKVKPETLEDAKRYIGTRVWKYFKEVKKYFEGEIVDVNTELEYEGQTLKGWFFRIHYFADDEEEDLDWDTFSRLMSKSNSGKSNKRKSSNTLVQDGDPAAARFEAAAEAAADALQRGSKRRRSAQQQQKPQQHTDDEQAEDDVMQEAGEETGSDFATGTASAAAVRSSKRRSRQQQQQQQQQDGGSTAAKKQQQRRRRSQDVTTPDQDESSDLDAAAEAVEADDDAGNDTDGADEQQQDGELGSEDFERMLAADVNEVVTVRKKGLAGHIKEVHVINFMCHSNFKMEFGTHVNVVSGSNGSGKSAVLQAMQCALGVKARNTGRGNKIGELVRQGCHEAKVSVTLWNTGEDAYRHDVFGDWVTVEQTIKVTANKNANSKWRLLDCHGRKVSERKDELHLLLDHLNIDAGNPLAVMTQDTSRSFLCGAVADKKKYDLFMQATMLDSMHENLKRAQGFVDEMKSAITEVKEMHNKRKALVQEYEQKLAKLNESAVLVEQLNMYERASLWAAVEDRKHALEINKELLEVKGPEGLRKHQYHLDQIEQQLSMLREKEETLTAESAEFQATQENFASEMRQLSEALKQARIEHRQKQKAFKTAETKLNHLQEELNSLLQSKNESNADYEREFREKLEQHNRDVEEAQAAIAIAEEQHAELEQQMHQLSQQKAAKEQEMRNVQQRYQQVQATVQNLQHQLQQLRQANGQKLALFGPHAQLREMVDRNRRFFDRLPIGPIGVHLTLANSMWDVATEVLLGGHLEKWIVHSQKDLQTLKQLAHQIHGMREPSIIKADFDRPAYQIPAHRQMPAGWQNLRQFVKVEHPHYAHIIDNKLMDLTRYECAVVDQDENRCKAAVYNHAVGPMVNTAVHVTGKNWTRQKKAVIAQNYYGGDKRPRVSQSFEATLRSMEDSLQREQGFQQQLHEQLKTLHGEVQQFTHQTNALNMQMRSALGNKMRAQNALSHLQRQAPVMEAVGDDNEDVLADQQRAVQDQIVQQQLVYNKAKAELDQATMKQEQCKQLHESRQAEMEEMLSGMNTRTEDLEQLGREKASLTEKQSRLLTSKQQFEQNLEAKKRDTELVEQQLQEVKEAALQHCTEEEGWQALDSARSITREMLRQKFKQRVETGKQAPLAEEELEAHIANIMQEVAHKDAVRRFKAEADKLHKKIASAENEAGGNRVELEAKRARAKADYDRHDRSVRNMLQIVHMTDKAVRERWTKYDELFDHVSTMVSQKFMAYMHRRGHQGKVRVEPSTGELKLLVKVNVQGQEAKKTKAVKDLKQLSGGERSFTTVAFILALGEFTESPFRAMDEFDVFMDAINRRIATQTLLEFAREKGHLQFVFLTPQDLQAVEDAKRKLAEDRNGKPLPDGFVKVVQMRPARPNQQQQ